MATTACASNLSGGGSAMGAVQQAATSGGSTASSITFRNRSNYAIFHIHMSSVNTTAWGPDQLGVNVLRAGGDFTLNNIPCDHYDLRLIDEDGDECVVRNIGVCDENSGWTIDNQDLLSCQGWTAAQ
jgi:hypothetical protein